MARPVNPIKRPASQLRAYAKQLHGIRDEVVHPYDVHQALTWGLEDIANGLRWLDEAAYLLDAGELSEELSPEELHEFLALSA